MSLALFSALAVFFSAVESTSVTIPLTPEGDIGEVIPHHFETKPHKPFHRREPLPVSLQITAVFDLASSLPSCEIDFALQWTAQSESPVVSSPAIATAARSGEKSIFISTHGPFIDQIGHDGVRPDGWPMTLETLSVSHSSPLVQDVDGDGMLEVGVVDSDANLHWIRTGEDGLYLEDYHVQIPKLRIRRDWVTATRLSETEGVSMFDRFRGTEKKSVKMDPLSSTATQREIEKRARKREEEQELYGRNHRRLTEDEHEGTFDIGMQDLDLGKRENAEFDENEFVPYSYGTFTSSHTDDGLGFYAERNYRNFEWQDEAYLAVDAHVLATPAIADLNGDGEPEIIFPVSYYFSTEEYRNKELDFDPSMYVASALVCWDSRAQEWLWTAHLDLSTTKSKHAATIHASPTIADLDGDGRPEVVAATGLGMLYVLEGETGFVRRFFPMQFNPIYTQVAIAELIPTDSSGSLSLVVLDAVGTVCVVSAHGDTIWDVQLTGELPFPATFADVDLDGQLDVLVVSVLKEKDGDSSKTISLLWALSGDTGATLAGFPIALPNRAVASASVTVSLSLAASHQDDNGGEKAKDRVRLFVPALDGFVYVMETRSKAAIMREERSDSAIGAVGCLQRVDAGYSLVTPALLDDLNHDGFLDLLVANLQGEVSLFTSSLPVQSSTAWAEFPREKGRSFTAGDVSIAVSLDEQQRLKSAELKSGQDLTIAFEIRDRRLKKAGRVYTVSIHEPSSSEPLWQEQLNASGVYSASFYLTSPIQTLLTLSLRSESGLTSSQSISVSLSTRFFVWIKLLTALPTLVVTILSVARLCSLPN